MNVFLALLHGLILRQNIMKVVFGKFYHLTLFTTKDNSVLIGDRCPECQKLVHWKKRKVFQEATKNGSKQVTEYDTSYSRLNCSKRHREAPVRFMEGS